MIDGIKHHYTWKTDCHKKFQAEVGKSIATVFDDEIPDPPQSAPSPEALSLDEGSQPDDIDVWMAGDDLIPDEHIHGLWLLMKTHLDSNPNMLGLRKLRTRILQK